MQNLSKIGLSFAVGVLSLSACKSKNESTNLSSFDDQAYFESLRKEKYISKTSKQVDIAALSELLPDTLDLSYGDLTFSEKSGATTLSDVNLTVADSEFGFNIESLSLWDVNDSAISDRLSGKNLDSDVSVLGRIEASNISAFGLESVFQPLFDASNDFNRALLEGTGAEDDFNLEQSLDEYDFSLGSFIATDFKIHPWVLDLTQSPFNEYDEPSENEAWHLLQKMAAWSHAMSYEDMAAYDGVFNLSMTQDDVPLSFDMKIGFMGYKGYARGDMEYGGVRDIGYVMDMAIPLDETLAVKSLKLESSTEVSTYEKMYLSQAMKHLAIGKMPDRDNTDFMSLGVWRGQGTKSSIDGQQIYSLDSYKLDMSEFHGMVPEIFDFEMENIKYNISGLTSWLETLQDDFGLDADNQAEFQTQLDQFNEILNRHNMGEPSFDLQLAMHWNADTGASEIGFGFGIDDVGRFKMGFDSILPTYDAAVELIPEGLDDFEGSELEALFGKTYAFEALSYEMRDEGFDNLLGLIIDFSKMLPEYQQNPVLKNATPTRLRQMMVGGISIGGAVAAEEFPPILDYIEATSDFVMDGGVSRCSSP